jgi:hypothetical protein
MHPSFLSLLPSSFFPSSPQSSRVTDGGGDDRRTRQSVSQLVWLYVAAAAGSSIVNQQNIKDSEKNKWAKEGRRNVNPTSLK